jgi:serine/threonine-protein kinase
MLTNSLVFDRDNDLEKLGTHVHDPSGGLRPLSPDLPAGLQDVLDRALAKDPRGPQQTAAQLAEDARAALQAG